MSISLAQSGHMSCDYDEAHLHETRNRSSTLRADPNSPDLLPACFCLCKEAPHAICHALTVLNHSTEVVNAEGH